MSLEKKQFLPPLSLFPTASKIFRLPCKDTLGASKPDAEEYTSHHTWLQELYAEFPSTLRRCSSALSRTSKLDETQKSPSTAVRSHVSLENRSPVKPLRTLRRVPGDSNLAMSSPKEGSSGCTMAEARELFKQHGIDRPAG